MKKLYTVLLVVAFAALAVGAMAGQGHKAGPTAAGKVVSVANDDQGKLASFVLRTGHGKTATIAVTETTKYKSGKKDATSADVKVGVRVVARLTAALADGKGTATIVNVAPTPATTTTTTTTTPATQPKP